MTDPAKPSPESGTRVPEDVKAAIEKLRCAAEAYGRSEGAPALMRVDDYTASNSAYIALIARLIEWNGLTYDLGRIDGITESK